MYEDLVKDLRELSHEFHLDDSDDYTEGKLSEAADAIEELQKAVYFHKYNSEFWEDKYNSLADEKWIPVTERLPEAESGDVSAQVLITDGECEALAEWFNFEICEPYWSYTGIGKITHWMPLPEPPKEET